MFVFMVMPVWPDGCPFPPMQIEYPDGMVPFPDRFYERRLPGISYSAADVIGTTGLGGYRLRFGGFDMNVSRHDDPMTLGFFVVNDPDTAVSYLNMRIRSVCAAVFRMREDGIRRVLDYSALQLDVNWPFAAKRGNTSDVMA